MRWSLRHVEGVGRLMRGRLRGQGIRTLDQLRDHIRGLIGEGSNATKKRRLQAFVDTITLNPRGLTCIEGYVPRKHNKFARDGLIGFMADDVGVPHHLLPTFRDKTRRPPRPGAPSPAFDKRVIPFEGGWAYPHGSRIPTTLRRPRSYPFGKAEEPPADLTRTQRDHALRTDPRFSQRRHFPCKCFKSRRTCEDFGPRRRNRLEGSRLSSCIWTNGECTNFVPRRSQRQRRSSHPFVSG